MEKWKPKILKKWKKIFQWFLWEIGLLSIFNDIFFKYFINKKTLIPKSNKSSTYNQSSKLGRVNEKLAPSCKAATAAT